MYTLKQASEKLGVSIITLRRYIKQGRLRARKVGKEYRIAKDDLDAFLAAPLSPEVLAERALETNEDYRWTFQRSDDLYKAVKLFRERGDTELADQAAKDALIFSYSLKTKRHRAKSEKRWGRFLPRMTGQDENGNDIARPDPAWIDAKLVEHAKWQSAKVKNPVTKAIYLDMIFEFSKNDDKPAYGRSAVAEYLMAADAESGSDERLLEVQGYILRALEIAYALKDKAMQKNAIDHALRTMDTFITENRMRIILELAESLLDNPKSLDASMVARICNAIDAAADYYANQAQNDYMARSFVELKYQLPSVKSDANERKKVQRQIFESYLREADAKSASGLVAAHFLAEALKVGGGVASNEERADLRRRIEEGNLKGERDMKQVSFNVEIKDEDIERYINGVLVDDISESLRRIGGMPGLIPSFDRAKRNAEQMMKDYPISHLFGRTTLQDGRAISISQGGHELNEDHIVYRLAQEIQMHGLFLGFLFDELKRKGLDAQKLAAYLSERDFFNNDSLPAVSEALESYFDNRYFTVVTVLPPLIEQLFRLANRKLGRPTLRSLDNGEQRVIYLGEALGNLNDIITDDMYGYFSLVLLDKRGLDLRDSATHGLLEFSTANRQQANLLLHLLLILAAFEYKEVKRTPDATGSDKEGA